MTIYTDLLDSKVSASLTELIAKWWRIHILVVTDTIVSFGPEHDPRNLNENYFGMSHLIGVLEQVAVVTRAHRTTDPLTAPGVVQNFHFDTADLTPYHQIWLLGYGSGTLPVAEQAALAAFMNGGGGVFATGDHATLGSALAGNLPRVRSMRQWQSPPPPLGATRVDTTRPDVNDVVVFENQSDDIPQVLKVKRYFWGDSAYARETYPHRLLCSSSGVITEFPDHMHEGEIVVPADLTQQMTLGGNTFDEYPMDSSGTRVSPEIIAWGFSTGRADPEVMTGIHVGDPSTSLARWTGTIGVYDGHQTGVGRVVVHSTWHHFFDINLIGDNAANRPGFTDPRKALWSQGFTASTNGQRILGQIDQYFRNIVHWLSPGVGILWFDGLVLQLARTHKVREVLDTGGKATASQLGAYAWQYALRYFPPCMLFELVIPPLLEIPVFRKPGDPGPGPFDSPFWPWPIGPRPMAQAALGGALQAFAGLKSAKDIHPEKGIAELRAGAIGALAGLLKEELGRSAATLKQLEAMQAHVEKLQAKRG